MLMMPAKRTPFSPAGPTCITSILLSPNSSLMDASASPVILGERVYFVTEVGEMDALLLETGARAWPASATMVGRLLADPLLSSEGILVPAMESECLIYAVEPETGAVRCLFSTE
jgi:hypothetical protein